MVSATIIGHGSVPFMNGTLVYFEKTMVSKLCLDSSMAAKSLSFL
jgi:hypothetical protein